MKYLILSGDQATVKQRHYNNGLLNKKQGYLKLDCNLKALLLINKFLLNLEYNLIELIKDFGRSFKRRFLLVMALMKIIKII